MLIISSINYSQDYSKFEIQLYGVPYYKLSNYFYENVMQQKSEYVKFDYSKRINQEVGFNVKYKFKDWKFGLGLSYNTFNFDHSLYIVDFYNYEWNRTIGYRSNELKMSTVGFSFLTERNITKTISLGARVSINNIIKNELKNEPYEQNVYLFGGTELNTIENHRTNGIRMLVIPEIYLNKTIYKGIDLIIGYKLKFFNQFYEPGGEFYSLTVRYGPTTVYRYNIDTFQTGFFFGASYTFKLPKLRKPKLD